ncbi:MAG: HEAT repeat domain-containing protein [Candidatus Thorarchaeota archaeon]|nr:HEAT repeat domain-containing protein [Candidatus Thorarchaeota archaeon]
MPEKPRQPVKTLSELLQDSKTSDKRRTIVEYIHHHSDEFEKVLDNSFSRDCDLKDHILDLVDLLSSTLMIRVIEKAITDDDSQIRVKGLQAAYRTRVDSVNVQVAHILTNPEEEFEARKWALHILGSTDPDYYVRKIMRIARDVSEDVQLRKEAVFALTKIVNDKTLGTLCMLLGESSVEMRQAGAWALSNIGAPESIICLLAALDDEDESVRDWATRGLRDMDDARALQGLADAIRSSSPEEQVRMTRIVIERRSEVILRVVSELLSSEDSDVRRTAAWALSVSPYPPAVPSLKTLLDDQDEQTRDYARIALIRSGELDSTDLKLG